MGKRECSIEEVQANVAEAEAENRGYFDVEVLVTGLSGTEIEFVQFGDRTGTRYKADFANRAQVWPKCPSTLPEDPKAAAPSPGEIGRIYLSEEHMQALKLTSSAPKWPVRMPAPPPPTSRLDVFPLRLDLTAIELKSGLFEKTTIDLLDPAYAKRTQTIVLDGGAPISLQLTQETFDQLYLPFTPDAGAVADAVKTIGAPKSRCDLVAALLVVARAASAIEAGIAVPGDVRENVDRVLARFR